MTASLWLVIRFILQSRMLLVDTNNILSIWPITTNWKEYVRSFFWYPISAFDHTVLVYHKKEITQKQWKDVGAGQSVLMIRHNMAGEAKESTQPFNKWLARIWFDLLYKYDSEKWETINIAKPDSTLLEFANCAFGTSRMALVMPSYDSCLLPSSISSFLFGIAVGHGKWTIKNDELFPIKITIPLTSSLLGKKEFFEKMTAVLHSNHIIHTVQYVQTGTYEVMQLTLHDAALLHQFSLWLDPIVKIAKISTLDYTQKVYEILVKYASEQELIMPIESASEIIVLQAD